MQFFPIGICLGLKDFFWFLTEIFTVAGLSLQLLMLMLLQLLLLLLLLLVSGMSTVPALVLCH
jgi:hypothetical protein